MIISAPSVVKEKFGRKKAAKETAKLERHKELWSLAAEAMAEVNPSFNYTAAAFTHNFCGSPHIDKQNLGPFYGIALGDFPEGEGAIQVECSARVVAEVNTKGRLGKVDGRSGINYHYT